MSGGNVKKVIARAVSDAGFRELFFRNPDGALGEYDLTEQEKASILAGSLPLPMPGSGDDLEPADDLASDLPIPLPDPADEPGGGGLEEIGKIDAFTLEADELGAAPAGPEVGDVGADVIDFQDGEDLLP